MDVTKNIGGYFHQAGRLSENNVVLLLRAGWIGFPWEIQSVN